MCFTAAFSIILALILLPPIAFFSADIDAPLLDEEYTGAGQLRDVSGE